MGIYVSGVDQFPINPGTGTVTITDLQSITPLSGGMTITGTTSGSSATNVVTLNVTDSSTSSSGYARGIYVNVTVSGDKTSSGEHNSVGVDQAVSGNTPYLYGYTYYSADTGDPTIGLACPISIYQDDLGSNVGAWFGTDYGYAFSNDMAGQFAVIRMRNHSSSIKPESMILGQCNNNYYVADYLLDFQGNPQGPIKADTSSVPSNATYKIKCRYGSTDFYLIGVADF